MNILKAAPPRQRLMDKQLRESVEKIIDKIIAEGDKALHEYSLLFDKAERVAFRVSDQEIAEAMSLVSPKLLDDLRFAASNIEKFARCQLESISSVEGFEPVEGVALGHRVLPVRSCGCYVPGGGYPLFSTALMLVIPAKVAGVKRVVACAPAMRGTGSIHPATLAAMHLAGADEIYALGGVQAIAALAYGSECIAPVDIIVGPGNQYVTEAKRQCYGQVGIDFLAGPSEVLIISDGVGSPDVIAADILAQCEHDPQARGILLTTDKELAQKVIIAVEGQLQTLSTADVARKAWENNSEIIIVDDLQEAFTLSNDYAPEHLELLVKDEVAAIAQLYNYGSLFIGENAAEVFGDYVSGTNHTLPTERAARYTGGVSVATFLKICTHQKMTSQGVAQIAPVAVNLASNEGLEGHAVAAQIRITTE